MAGGDMHRDSDSAGQAGEMLAGPRSVRLTLDHVDALSAVTDKTGRLKLISWRIRTDIRRLQDSGAQAGNTPRLSLARVRSTFDRYVTAVVADGHEKLISWNVAESGAVARMEDSGANGAQHINGVSVVGRNDFDNVVTGVWDGNRELRLETWRMNQNGQFTRRGDSGSQAGEIQGEPTLLALASGLVVSVVVTKESILRLITWGVESDGDLRRRRDSGSSAGEVHSLPAAVVLFEDLIVTAVSDSNSNLKLIAWHIEADGTVSRRGNSGSQAGRTSIPPSITDIGGRIVTAVADQDDRLKLISWAVSSDGRSIQRGGDSAAEGEVVTAAPDVHTSPHSNTGLVTTVRAQNGALKLIAWTLEPF